MVSCSAAAVGEFEDIDQLLISRVVTREDINTSVIPTGARSMSFPHEIKNEPRQCFPRRAEEGGGGMEDDAP